MRPNKSSRRSATSIGILFALATFLGTGCSDSSDELMAVLSDGPVTVWIAGGNVIDGTGAAPRRADVLIRGESIVYVGLVGGVDVGADRKIDATGKFVTPGFIDAHAHGSPGRTPDFSNFLAMGVTTISLGQDGSGPDWEDVGAHVDSLNAIGTGPNVAYFSGHGTIRRMSGVGYDTAPSAEGVAKMVEILDGQLAAGFFGMTTGLEYTPGIYSADPELLALAEAVGERDGLIMSHMRDEDDDKVETSIRELLRQGDHARVQVSHMKSVYGKGVERAEELLALLDSARTAGIDVTADMYPYSASYTGIGIVFPTWAKAPNDYDEVKRTRRGELAEYIRNRVNLRNGPEATLLGTGEYESKTLADLVAETGKPFEDILIDDIGPDGASGAYFVMNDALQERLAQYPFMMFCSDGSPTGFHPRGHGTFAKILETYVVEKQLFPVEEAIRKMTSLPARTIGLDRRGELRTGYVADIAVFDLGAVRAKATYANPLQLSEGFDAVLVGGKVAFENGAASVERSGRILVKQPR